MRIDAGEYSKTFRLVQFVGRYFLKTIFVVVVVVVVVVVLVVVIFNRFLVKFFRSYIIAHCNVDQIIFRRTSVCRSQVDVHHLFVLLCFPH